MTRSLLGARGERPIRLPVASDDERLPGVLAIPGVVYDGQAAVWCAWDVGPIVARALGYQLPPPPLDAPNDYPGYQRYLELGFPEKLRWYQIEAVRFLMQRSWALLCDGMRTGKTLSLLAADLMVGSKRTLIVAPALAKWVWAREIAKWMGTPCLIIEGRAANEAREYCVACSSTGELSDGSDCTLCVGRNGQSLGFRLFEVSYTSELCVGRDPKSGGRFSVVPKTFHCPRHELVRSSDEDRECDVCLIEFQEKLKSSRYVLSNYEILSMHHDHDLRGVEHGRSELPGYADRLRKAKFDVAILDEIHRVRGRTKPDRFGISTRDRLKMSIRHVPIVWGATGTPIYGFTRDYQSLLDITSGGLFGNGYKHFDTRYCEGVKGLYRWEADGTSIYAETELKERLSFCQIKRSRKDLFGDKDVKVRQVHYIDPSRARMTKAEEATLLAQGPELAYDAGLRRCLPDKIEMLMKHLTDELSEGLSAIVFTKLIESAKILYDALEKEVQKPDVRTRMKQVNVQLWFATGETPAKTRVAMTDKFREHIANGMAGVFFGSVGAFQEAASLGGAANVHHAELPLEPGMLEQAEERAFSVGCGLLTCQHYIVKKSADQAALKVLYPKFEAQEKVTDDHAAAELRKNLSEKERVKLSAEAVFARLTRHIRAHADAGADADD